jgi:adenosine kinase
LALQLIITGSIAFDYLMSFPGKFSDHLLADQLDHISVSFLVESLNRRRGGCAANIAYNLALLGEHPLLVGTVGKDFNDYRVALEKVGVDTTAIYEMDNEYTASFFANTDQDGNQISSFYAGAMRFSEKISLKSLKGKTSVLVMISPNDPETMIRYVHDCHDMNLPFIYDPGQQIVRLSGQSLIDGATEAKIVIMNDYEHEMFKKKTGLTIGSLLELSEIVVITKGGHGSHIQTKQGAITIPIAQPEHMIDPTGVGDAYRAGLIKGMVAGLPLDVSGRMGSLAATYVLETDGPQNHTYTIDSFVKRYIHHFGESKDVRRLISE